MEICIRNETPNDAAAIEAVTAAAFLEAPHTSHTEQFIVAALRAAGALSVSLVAEAEGAVVGHVAVSPVTISDGAIGWYGLRSSDWSLTAVIKRRDWSRSCQTASAA